MKVVLALALAVAAFASLAQDQEIQRALIQRDQQSAEFAARVRGAQDTAALQELHARQLREALQPLASDPQVARQLQPYQRQKMADERELRLPPPVTMVNPPEKPLPLPGGPKHGVDPIPSQGSEH
jgi:membrane-bound lytic murein transglycosylase B